MHIAHRPVPNFTTGWARTAGVSSTGTRPSSCPCRLRFRSRLARTSGVVRWHVALRRVAERARGVGDFGTYESDGDGTTEDLYSPNERLENSYTARFQAPYLTKNERIREYSNLGKLFGVLAHAQVYPSQTKILEGGTKDEIRIFEALFKGVSTRFGLRTIEKCFENPDFIFCSSFPNLRLGTIKLLQKNITSQENQHITVVFCTKDSGSM